MLSFELSAIDLILAIAVIILLVLYITRLSARPPAEERLLVRKESSSEKRVTEAAVPDEEGRDQSRRSLNLRLILRRVLSALVI